FVPNGRRFRPDNGACPDAGTGTLLERDPTRGEEVSVSIGATLAAARRRAGLTVSDVSQRTRVTEPIIRGIEQDDYAACGGDFYARGHIRAIARAVGEGPLALIDGVDSTWGSGEEVTAAGPVQPGLPVA